MVVITEASEKNFSGNKFTILSEKEKKKLVATTLKVKNISFMPEFLQKKTHSLHSTISSFFHILIHLIF